MEITFPELEELIAETAEEVSDADELEGKAQAAGELLGQTRALGEHIGGYARIAWYLDMLCSLVMILPLCTSLLPEGSPRGIYGAVDSLFQGLFGLLDTTSAIGYRFFFLILLILPVVYDLILSAVCKRTLIITEQPISGAKTSGSNVIQRIRSALYDAQGELNPTNFLPAWTVYLVGAVFMVNGAVLLHSTVTARETVRFLTVLAAILLFFLIFVLFVAVLWVKLFVLSLCFSSGRCKRELRELLEELPDYEAEYQEAEEARAAAEAEQRRLADLKEGAELYRKATAETTVNKVLLARAAQKGDPHANLEIGRTMVENVDGLNRREVAARYENAKKHFRIADEANLPDGILMYASARLMTEAHDVMGWLNILRRLRAVDRIQVSTKHRSFYTKVRDQLIERVQVAMAHSENSEDQE